MSASHSTSKTANQTESNQTTNLTTINKNLSGNSGLVANADEGATLNLSYAPISINTDAGAVDAGARVANAGISATVTSAALAIDAAGHANDVIRSLAGDVVTQSGQTIGGTLNFARDVIGTEHANTSRALDIVLNTSQRSDELARDLAGGAAEFAGTVLTQFGNRLAEYQQAEQTQLGNVVSALSSSFVDNSKTADQRVTDATLEAGAQAADTLREVFKYITIAAVAAGAIFLLSRGKRVFA